MTNLLQVLQDFHRDKLTQLLRHEAAARLIAQYDANNTYQYVINREQAQLSWLAVAIADLGGTAADVPQPERAVTGKGGEAAAGLFREDARDAQAFVAKWRPQVDALTNARHRGMLGVILGETLEQNRFFEQALAGRTDLLGRRGAQLLPARGEVLSTRWVE